MSALYLVLLSYIPSLAPYIPSSLHFGSASSPDIGACKNCVLFWRLLFNDKLFFLPYCMNLCICGGVTSYRIHTAPIYSNFECYQFFPPPSSLLPLIKKKKCGCHPSEKLTYSTRDLWDLSKLPNCMCVVNTWIFVLTVLLYLLAPYFPTHQAFGSASSPGSGYFLMVLSDVGSNSPPSLQLEMMPISWFPPSRLDHSSL